MNRKSPYPAALVCLLSCALAIPFDAFARPDATGQRAGEVSRVIPAVSLARGAKSMTASAKTAVDWQDVLSTQANDLAGVCVGVKAGQITTVRNGDSNGPAAPSQANLSTLSDAVASTTLESAPGIGQIHHIGKGTAIAIGIIAIIPIIVVPIVTTRGSGTPAPVPTNGCPKGSPNCG